MTFLAGRQNRADGRKQEQTAGGRGRRQEKNILRRAVKVKSPTPARLDPRFLSLPPAPAVCFLCVGPSGSDHPAAFDRLGGPRVVSNEICAVESGMAEVGTAERLDRCDVLRDLGDSDASDTT